jgi:ribosome-binding factor A
MPASRDVTGRPPRAARGSGRPTQRQLRVGEALRHALADLLERGHVRDPALAGVSVTITEVRPSPDLRSAVVFVMPLGGARAEQVVEALQRAAPYLRHGIAERVSLKFLPALRFALDETFDAAGRIDALLRSPAVARDLGRRSGDEPDDGA